MKWLDVLTSDIERLMQIHGEQLERIRKKKARLDGHRPMPVSILRKLREQINLEWTYNSNAIEGNTINLAETKMVLEEGFTVRGKSLREHLEITNHHDAIAFTEHLASNEQLITHTDVRSLHELVLRSIDKEMAGMYRTGSVRIVGANFTPPAAHELHALMDELLGFVNDAHPDWPVLVKAMVFHHRFVWIHPFFDGNGRTGRLLLNLYLMRQGYPPAIILKVDRKKYIDALNQANVGEYGKLILLMVQALERSLDLYLSALDDEGGAYSYKPIDTILREAELPYGQEYMSLLARQGKIDAYKEGRVWYTSQHSISYYLDRRKRKRTP